MAKTKKPKTIQPQVAATGLIPAGLGTDFETVQIIPATGYWATYKDGSRNHVVAWAMQSRLLTDDERKDWLAGDDEVPPLFISRVVGLVMCGTSAVLAEANSNFFIDSEDEFTGYEFDV